MQLYFSPFPDGAMLSINAHFHVSCVAFVTWAERTKMAQFYLIFLSSDAAAHAAASHQADACDVFRTCLPAIRLLHAMYAMSSSHACQPSGWCMRCLPHMPAIHQADACDVFLTCLPAIRLMHAMSSSHVCQPSGWCMRCLPHMPARHQADACDVCDVVLTCMPAIRLMDVVSYSHECQPSC